MGPAAKTALAIKTDGLTPEKQALDERFRATKLDELHGRVEVNRDLQKRENLLICQRLRSRVSDTDSADKNTGGRYELGRYHGTSPC